MKAHGSEYTLPDHSPLNSIFIFSECFCAVSVGMQNTCSAASYQHPDPTLLHTRENDSLHSPTGSEL